MDKYPRSFLFVPAKKKFLEKAIKLNLENVILDLEDSLLDSEKENGLHILKNFLNENKDKIGSMNYYVRVNKDKIALETEELKDCPIRGYMIPKVESLDFFDKNEALNSKNIIALIETPKGVINIEKIIADSRIETIAFGAEDYCISANIKKTSYTLKYAKSRVATYSLAYNKKAYDTPSFSIYNTETFCGEIIESRDNGFYGKLAIKPDQIEIINNMFSDYNYDHMQYIVDKFEKANEGVVVLDGKVYERNHIDNYKRIIERGKR